MAKQSLTYKCGHPGAEEMSGNTAARRSRADWISQNKVCPDCYRQELLQQAKASAALQGLPDLEGTPAQVDWAITVRFKQIAKIEDLYFTVQSRTKQHPHPGNDELIRIATEALNKIRSLTSAKWFIDHRDCPTSSSSGGGLIEALVPDFKERLAPYGETAKSSGTP